MLLLLGGLESIDDYRRLSGCSTRGGNRETIEVLYTIQCVAMRRCCCCAGAPGATTTKENTAQAHHAHTVALFGIVSIPHSAKLRAYNRTNHAVRKRSGGRPHAARIEPANCQGTQRRRLTVAYTSIIEMFFSNTGRPRRRPAGGGHEGRHGHNAVGDGEDASVSRDYARTG